MDLTQKFLLQSSMILEKYTPICTQLRNKCFNEKMGGVAIDKSVACKWCYTSWSDGRNSVRIKPKKKKTNKNHPKLFNVMVIICDVCHKKTNIILPKEPPEKIPKDVPEPIIEEKKIKKKNKKKDQFAGLNPAVFNKDKPNENTLNIKIKPKPVLNSSLLESIKAKKTNKKRNRKKKTTSGQITSVSVQFQIHSRAKGDIKLNSKNKNLRDQIRLSN